MLETMLLKVSTPLMLLPSIRLCIFTLLAIMSSAWLTSPEAQICSSKGWHQPPQHFFAYACNLSPSKCLSRISSNAAREAV